MDIVSTISKGRCFATRGPGLRRCVRRVGRDLFVGSPDERLAVHDVFGYSRIGMGHDFGGIDAALANRSTELRATEVLPEIGRAIVT